MSETVEILTNGGFLVEEVRANVLEYNESLGGRGKTRGRKPKGADSVLNMTIKESAGLWEEIMDFNRGVVGDNYGIRHLIAIKNTLGCSYQVMAHIEGITPATLMNRLLGKGPLTNSTVMYWINLIRGLRGCFGEKASGDVRKHFAACGYDLNRKIDASATFLKHLGTEAKKRKGREKELKS